MGVVPWCSIAVFRPLPELWRLGIFMQTTCFLSDSKLTPLSPGVNWSNRELHFRDTCSASRRTSTLEFAGM